VPVFFAATFLSSGCCEYCRWSDNSIFTLKELYRANIFYLAALNEAGIPVSNNIANKIANYGSGYTGCGTVAGIP
jgi:hypothetical protein